MIPSFICWIYAQYIYKNPVDSGIHLSRDPFHQEANRLDMEIAAHDQKVRELASQSLGELGPRRPVESRRGRCSCVGFSTWGRMVMLYNIDWPKEVIEVFCFKIYMILVPFR